MRKISQEIDALLRYYGNQKNISVKDIREFSETYPLVQQLLGAIPLPEQTEETKDE